MANPKILIVDDEPFNVDYLEQELEDFNYNIITASNGQEALDRIERESPDLVLLDIMMPVMDGFEVLSRLKRNPATRDIPVIVISANNNLQSVVQGIQLGAEDYLPKPFEPVLLHARITSSLEKKRLQDLQQLYLKGLERELDIARDIQQSFLPLELPDIAGFEIAAYFKAARDVAGDFYDAFTLPGDQLVCVIGDVCGKGVGAALYMTLFRSLIRAMSTIDFTAAIDKPALTPAERLQQTIRFTNQYVIETHGDRSLFTTAFIGLINPQNNQLIYANCGNEPPLLLRKGRVVTSLQPTGPVIGVVLEASFSVRELTMENEDLLLVFTDGVTDALNRSEQAFGQERLLEAITGCDATAATLLKRIEDQLRGFAGAAEQFDDITMLAVKKTQTRNYPED